MKGTEAQDRIANDPDFVYLKRFENSLAALMQRYPDGVPNRIIASALMITEEDVEDIYQQIVDKLRINLKVV